MAQLLVLFGNKQGLRLPLISTLVVGRATTADLQLVDSRVSREHCRIEVSSAGLRLTDLGSQNGTFRNGERITEATLLNEGDEIAVGDSLLLIAGEGIRIANARYGVGTLMATRDAVTVHARAAPVSRTAEERIATLGRLARRIAAAPDEEAVVQAVIDQVLSVIQPERASLLLSLSRPTDQDGDLDLVPLCSRGPSSLSSICVALLSEAQRKKRAVSTEAVLEVRAHRREQSVVTRTLRSLVVVPWSSARQDGFLVVDRAAGQPFDHDDVGWLEAVAELAAVGLRSHRLALPIVATGPVGDSLAFREARAKAEAAARVDSTVLLLGETGTGKEELARLIHQHSRRSEGPWVAVNCGAIAEGVAESELFGHEKGAFTGASCTRLGAFETADRGTLFLDEVGDLSQALQVRLLRVLQERAVVRVGSTLPRGVDVRIIAATHRSLVDEVRSGRFREDLFFRLNVVEIRLPALRERLDDVPRLVPALLTRIAARLGLGSLPVTDGALKTLMGYSYPGNVRELQNVLERILVLREPTDTAPIDADDVAAVLGHPLLPMPAPISAPADETLAQVIRRVEKTEIEAALRRARGIKSQAARQLGISRPTLDKKIAELCIDLWAKEP